MTGRPLACLKFVAYSTLAALVGCGNIDLQATMIPASTRGSTFKVSGRSLYDPCRSQQVVLRGVNEMVTYIADYNAQPAFTEIARTLANSVRIYWRTTDSSDNLDKVLFQAESSHLIPIVYVFKNESSNSTPTALTQLSEAVDYWTKAEVAQIVKQHQDWIILALREKINDPHDTADRWAARFDEQVARVRAAGINVPLAIDAPNGGSDVPTLLTMEGQVTVGEARILADTQGQGNLLLNVNADEAGGDTESQLVDHIRAAYADDLPLLIGELSGVLYNTNDYNCVEAFALPEVLAAAQDTKTGWLAWSWGYKRNLYCTALNMTSDGTYAGLGTTPPSNAWGLAAAVTDPNSIQNQPQTVNYRPGAGCPSR